ncbi:MAG: hypothetical protein H7263_02375 [Candidatus Sericytochromatia bacterium]|nr:hypothetical protein [Candidatus Sericytochromatia bacterium]
MSFENFYNQFDTFNVGLPIFFNLCANVEEMRTFYTEILGIKENYYQKNNFIDYNSNGLTMMFFQADSIINNMSSAKKRYSQGHFESLLWTIKIDQDAFIKAIQKLSNHENQIKYNLSTIQWNNDGFWNFSVDDPMWNKIIIYMQPKSIPVSKIWNIF